ncbi:MAG: hypothetical protein LUC50_04275, partial [Ruminococcus sp.]|nr:hypothetical protein [Ruminococcus sp.]
WVESPRFQYMDSTSTTGVDIFDDMVGLKDGAIRVVVDSAAVTTTFTTETTTTTTTTTSTTTTTTSESTTTTTTATTSTTTTKSTPLLYFEDVTISESELEANNYQVAVRAYCGEDYTKLAIGFTLDEDCTCAELYTATAVLVSNEGNYWYAATSATAMPAGWAVTFYITLPESAAAGDAFSISSWTGANGSAAQVNDTILYESKVGNGSITIVKDPETTTTTLETTTTTTETTTTTTTITTESTTESTSTTKETTTEATETTAGTTTTEPASGVVTIEAPYIGNLYVGNTFQLDYTIDADYTGTIAWLSTDGTIATVTQDGTVTVCGEGTVTIHALDGTGSITSVTFTTFTLAATTTSATTSETTTISRTTTTMTAATTTTTTTTATTAATETAAPSETTTTTTETITITLGDLDGDGSITIQDAYNALMAYSKTSAGLDAGLTDAQREAADVDGDGKVTINDAYKILLYYATRSVGGMPSWD